MDSKQLEQEQGQKAEEWLNRTGKQYAKQPLGKGSRLIRRGAESPVVQAFNQALREQRRREQN
jgi:hypothetical protein